MSKVIVQGDVVVYPVYFVDGKLRRMHEILNSCFVVGDECYSTLNGVLKDQFGNPKPAVKPPVYIFGPWAKYASRDNRR